MAERLSFEDEISRNKLKSFFLIFVIFIFFIALGYAISLALDPSYFFFVMIISVIFSLGYILISYYNSDKIALASVRARPANAVDDRMLLHAVENMSLASGLPMPKVYVMQSAEINAFASGRNPQNAVICVTTGAVEKLSKQELEGVIAHEMSHIANYDIRFMTIAAIMIGMISIIAQIFLRNLWFSNHNSRNEKGNAVFMLIAIIMAILAPIAAQLVQLAISRKREFAADASGVKFTRFPPGLKGALEKINKEQIDQKEMKKFSPAIAPLFISDPFKKKLSGLFATHPPIDVRIERLKRM